MYVAIHAFFPIVLYPTMIHLVDPRSFFKRPQGSEINAVLPETKSSPAMTSILRLVIAFQLAHPSATKEDCCAYLKGEGLERVRELVRDHVVQRPPKKVKKAA